MILAALLLFLQYAPAGRPPAAIGGSCVSGSFSDSFAGTAGTLLTVHNPGVYANVDGTYLVGLEKLSGSTSVQLNSGFDSGGAILSCSTSDTAQITIVGSGTLTTGAQKFVGVRATTNVTKGYTVSPCYNDGGSNWGRVCLYKNGSEIAQSALGSYNPATNHTLKITASGTSSVLVTGYIDGVSVVTSTDTTSTIVSGSPCFYMNGTGTIADSRFTNFQDH